MYISYAKWTCSLTQSNDTQYHVNNIRKSQWICTKKEADNQEITSSKKSGFFQDPSIP
jgi:hypothetical protein